MNRLLLFFLFYTFTQAVLAQSKTELSLVIGPAFPSGYSIVSYSDKYLKHSNMSFEEMTNIGWATALSLDFKTEKNIGFSTALQYQSFLNNDALYEKELYSYNKYLGDLNLK